MHITTFIHQAMARHKKPRFPTKFSAHTLPTIQIIGYIADYFREDDIDGNLL